VDFMCPSKSSDYFGYDDSYNHRLRYMYFVIIYHAWLTYASKPDVFMMDAYVLMLERAKSFAGRICKC
jgi:hypothetical protein